MAYLTRWKFKEDELRDSLPQKETEKSEQVESIPEIDTVFDCVNNNGPFFGIENSYKEFENKTLGSPVTSEQAKKVQLRILT
jgi:hypothetical protein